MTTILEQLAAGRIDAAEAARRIDALKAQAPADSADASVDDRGRGGAGHTEAGQPETSTSGTNNPGTNHPEPTNEELAGSRSDQASGTAPEDAWAAATDRPQQATYTTESFAPPTAAEDAGSVSDPTRGSGQQDSGQQQSAQQDSGQQESAQHESGQQESAQTSSDSRSGAGSATSRQSSGPRQSGGVERLSIRAVGRRVRIIGEPSVATVSADGPHVLRRNGSVLEVSSDGELGASMDGFTLLKAPRNLDDIRSLGLGKELFLRVNPNIVVDVEVTAGSLHTERVPHLGKVRVTAGGAKLLDVEEISDALIQAGQATIKGSIKTGRSRVRAESGSLSVHLADDSNVTVKGESQLGKISWSGGHSGAGDEVVMGNGSARLDVEVVMGHASVRVGTEPSDSDGASDDQDGQE